MAQELQSPRFALSDIRWFPILTCALVADASAWYSVAMGTNDGDSIGLGFFAVFGIDALRRWIRRRDRFHMVAGWGAVVALGVMALRETDRFDPSHLLPYLLFILFSVLGSVLSHASKRGARA
jgi:hypothetical protein